MYIGIDPGATGGIVQLTLAGQVMGKWVIPLKDVKSKKKGKKTPDETIDLEALCRLLERFQGNQCVLEEVHAIFGSAAGSTFKMGQNFGKIEAALACAGIEYTLIPPKQWQGEIWEPGDMVKSPSSTGKSIVTDTKATSLNTVKRLFPGEDFIQGDNEKPSNRKKKFHDGLVDAALIALYAKSYYEK